MWLPLREVQAEQRAAEAAKKISEAHNAALKLETDYGLWRNRALEKREDMIQEFSPRGNSLKINLSGVTPRGPLLATPRGFQSAVQLSAGTAHSCLVHKSGQLYTWGVGVSGRLGLDTTEEGDPQKDVVQPRLVQALAGRTVIRVSCGYSHTGAIVAGGELYMWGSAATGKCGLGEIVQTEECFCSIPTRVMVGAEDRRVRKLSCGAAHSAVVTEAGQLYVFGCGDGGRLGTGKGDYRSLFIPTLVKSLLHERISSVSCGNTTTIVCTEIKHEWKINGESRQRVLTGGLVYKAGSQSVLGHQCDEFVLLEELQNTPIKLASAGYQHTVAVSADGELYAWGHNSDLCCGSTPKLHFIPHPTVIPVMFTNPNNIALGKNAYQSSTYNNREARYAINGEKEGNGLKKCTCTQQDSQAWFELDLGKMAIIEEIRLWNRTDVPNDKMQPKDLFTARLFPCWVMVSRDPFNQDLNQIGLKENMRNAVAKVKFTEDMRMSSWHLPANSQAQFIRVQLEAFETLSIAEIEVFGHFGLCRGVGRVAYAAAGRNVTVAVVRPSTDPKDIEIAYKRAAYADALNADILRQIETFALEYDKFGRGEVTQKECLICKGPLKCESCNLYVKFKQDIAKMPPAVGGRRRRLKSIDDFLMNANKPELEPIILRKKIRPTKWEMRKENWKKWLNMQTKAWFPRRDLDAEAALNAEPKSMLERLMEEEEAKARLENGGVPVMALPGLLSGLVGKDAKTAPEEEKKESASITSEGIKVGDVLLTGNHVRRVNISCCLYVKRYLMSPVSHFSSLFSLDRTCRQGCFP